MCQELQELAEEVVGLDRYHQVAMGQGQSTLAVQLLRDCSRDGHWLCLKNLHLVTAWLPVLEKASVLCASNVCSLLFDHLSFRNLIL